MINFNFFKDPTQENGPFKSLELPKYYFESFIEERTPELLKEAGQIFRDAYPNGPRISKTVLPNETLTVPERMEHISNEIKNRFRYGR
jgi:hypothetical protein